MSFNTFGWDTVYVIAVSAVNKALAANQNQTLTKLDYEDGPIKMTGTFGPWSVVPGGSGKNLRLQFPITSGTFVSPSQPDADLTGVALIADVDLELLPSGTDLKDLVFNLQAVAKKGQEGPGLVTPINLLDPDGHLNTAQHAEVLSLLPVYLVQQASNLSFSFAQLNFAKPATNSWLAPVASDYAYMEKNDGSGFLGILSVTTQRDISSLPREIDDGIVSGSNDAGLFVAADLFLKNVVTPAFPHAYPGGHFAYDASNQTIHNLGSFSTPSVKSGAITYDPEVDSLVASLSGGNLVTDIQGSVDLKAGINMTYSVGTSNGTRFDPGAQALEFLPDPHPSSSHSVHVPWYYVLGAGIADAVANIVADLIASSISDTLVSRARVTLSDGLDLQVHWTDTTSLTVTDAGLDGPLWLQGNLG